jgi:hypothetical protein
MAMEMSQGVMGLAASESDNMWEEQTHSSCV